MDSITAFTLGRLNRDKELKVFDWNKAAEMIKKSPDCTASAGLEGDWEWTGDTIFEGGRPVPKEDAYTYLASTWANPQIEINGVCEPCYKMESETDSWNSGTYWPDSALHILGIKP